MSADTEILLRQASEISPVEPSGDVAPTHPRPGLPKFRPGLYPQVGRCACGTALRLVDGDLWCPHCNVYAAKS